MISFGTPKIIKQSGMTHFYGFGYDGFTKSGLGKKKPNQTAAAVSWRETGIPKLKQRKGKKKTMGQGPSGGFNKGGAPGERKQDDKKDKKYEPAAPPSRVGRKQRKQKGPEAAARLPTVTPLSKCKLRLLKLDRIKDYLLMEEEFVANQERLKPQEEKNEEDRSKVDDLRGSPMSVGNLEELIDENHAIVSSSVGPEYYVGILSFVDKDQLEPGCAILMHNKVSEFDAPLGLFLWLFSE